jgi:hypothetical protein
MGHRSPAVRAFADLLQGEIQKDIFLRELKTESEYQLVNSRQNPMLGLLGIKLDFFSSTQEVINTSEKVSSRVKRFFRAYSNLTRRECHDLSLR